MQYQQYREVPGISLTEKIGTRPCMLIAREKRMQKLRVPVDDAAIEEVMCCGGADNGKHYLEVIRETAAEYAAGIGRRRRESGQNPERIKPCAAVGGSCLIRNFTDHDPDRITIRREICAAVKAVSCRPGGIWEARYEQARL